MFKVLAATALLALAGCSAPTTSTAIPTEGDGRISVVASTNVYGSLAMQIGGNRVDVTSIITSATQDPHSYEATARDRLSVERAALVIENGGGYDSFIDTLLGHGGDQRIVTAVEHLHAHPDDEGHDAEAERDHGANEGHGHGAEEGHEGHGHIEAFNEHVWFDPHTMIHVVGEISAELAEFYPQGTADFKANAAALTSELEGFEGELEMLKTEFGGAEVVITEPLPGYLAEAAGLVDVTPQGFAAAVEEGTDVAPSILLTTLDVIGSGQVRALLTNAQTGGAETQRVEEATTDAGIPVVAFTELLANGSSYSEWMRDAIKSLADALRS